MKIYLARHGQVSLEAKYRNGDAFLPRGEHYLSPLGREQATLLGKFLANRNFHGTIYASPFWRTMETAEIIARETQSTILPATWIHEILMDQSFLDDFRGTPLDQLKEWYPHIAQNAVMEFPWWPLKPEDSDIVMKRVSAGIDKLLDEYGSTDEEILLVGHGASIGAANDYLGLRRTGMLWNCSLGMYDSKNPQQSFGKNISFLPGQMVSNNHVMALDLPDERCPDYYKIKIPDELKQLKGFKLLHIGDTHSATYPFFRYFIRQIKPDVIIHTGDTADEDKVGSDITVRESYFQKAGMLADILKEADCPVYWVPGNNDLPEEIAKLAPFFKLVQPDTVLDVEGLKICVAHSRQQISGEADYYLYGHARVRGESFEDELAFMGDESRCLNTMWNIFVLTLPEQKLYRIERP